MIAEHGCKVLLNYDIHDASKIIVRRMDATYLCEGLLDTNKYLPLPDKTLEYQNRQERIKGCAKRGVKKSGDR
ncbi:MAG: Mu transposase C-terminal domain-containing protein [Arsenophonus sp. NEOnobi-MAG3]